MAKAAFHDLHPFDSIQVTVTLTDMINALN